jgi:TRAP-type C4-dicarboxylate transport system permease small subunit
MLRTTYAQVIGNTVQAPRSTVIEEGLPSILNMAINLVLGIGIALTIIFLIIGGIQYVTSRGDQKAADTARKSLTNAVIGFIIVIGAFSIRILLAKMIGTNANVTVNGVFNPGL